MTDQQSVEHLWQDGYLLIRGALPPDQLARIQAAHDRMGEPDRIIPDGNHGYNNLLDKDPVFAELVRHPAVDGVLTGLLGAGYAFYRIGGLKTVVAYSQPWHWDDVRWIQYCTLAIDQRPENPPPVAAHTTFYLDSLTPETGFVKVPPGSHRRIEVLTAPVFRPDEGNEPFGPEVHLYPAAGDAIVYISHLPHRGVNFKPDMQRRLVVALYGPPGTQEGGTY
ncbi:MAG: phytanoyl-CoA dioxygenase family protein [Candidatus Latescibacteria bacterium]|nr:phytanoyl-CoA dioxygenase family protein [Candidatus Latescibacterota bacterium]